MEGDIMASKYTYTEDIERQRYWVECKTKKRTSAGSGCDYR